MKSSFLLSGVLLLSAPILALAQNTTQPNIGAATEPGGYELLVQAGKAMLPGPNGGPSSAQKLTPEENLKNERLAVARNAAALALVRSALKKPIKVPDIMPGTDDFKFYANIRELARQLSQESDVRFAHGDFAGAMNSRLDAMEMGAAIGHGSLIALLVGVAVEAIGSRDVDKFAGQLDEAQCRTAVARLGRIEARRTALAEALRYEQKFSLSETLRRLRDDKALDEVRTFEGTELLTAKDIAEFKALSPEQITANNERLFGAVIETAKLSYGEAVKVKLPQDLDPVTKMALTYLEGGGYRFSYDRSVAQVRLLSAALELRSHKQETGSYPDNFTAPVDPFAAGDKPLVYRRTGKDYLLYSVGPDGKDDGGAELQSSFVDPASGLNIISDRLLPTSTGDIMQLPF